MMGKTGPGQGRSGSESKLLIRQQTQLGPEDGTLQGAMMSDLL